MNKIFVGLDVSKLKIDCALRLGNKKHKMKVITNNKAGFTELLKFLSNNHIDLSNPSSLHFCCEATNVYWEGVANFLADNGFGVSVVNPMQIKKYAELVLSRLKNDKADARLISDYCEKHTPELWVQPPVEVVQLSALLKHLDRLKGIRTQVSNNELVSGATVSDLSQSHMIFIDAQIAKLERMIRSLIKENPELKAKYDLLMTIPSVGELTSSMLLTLLFDAIRFQTSRHVVSFIGLSPKERKSGTSVNGRSGISKIGDSNIRKALYMPAMVGFSRLPIFKLFVDRLKSRGKPVKVIIVALMRKLVVIAHAILKSGQPFCEKRFLGA